VTPRRVLVDAAIVKPNLGGLRTYIRGLVGGLAQRDDVELHVVTSCPEDFATVAADRLIACPPATRGFVARAAWREAALARIAVRTRADLVLVPYPEMTFRPLPVPAVMVVHDVRGLVAPRYETAPRRLRFRLALGRACRVASRIVCVSESTAMGLDASVRVDPARVAVIGEAAPVHRDDAGGSAQSEPVARTYVLYVGSLLPHKNVDTLIRAFAHGSLGRDLVLVGPASQAEMRHVVGLIYELGCQDRVRHLGWLDDHQLRHCYRGAAALAIPSLYEGFGLPLLEGMEAGVPVIASDIPAFREVAGGYASLVDRPRDPLAWQEAVRASAFDATRIAMARDWARKTSWADIAAAFVTLFDERSMVSSRP
jgi:glycosyltransferase involved in cell wall biosynthesis